MLRAPVRLLVAAALVLVPAACSGTGRDSVRTAGGPTTTAAAGAAAPETATTLLAPGVDPATATATAAATAGGLEPPVGGGTANPSGTVPGNSAGGLAGAEGGRPAGAGPAPASGPTGPIGPIGPTGPTGLGTSSTPSPGTPPPTAPPRPATAGELAAWCPAERTLERRLAAVDTNATPSAIQMSVAAARAAIGPALDTAPAEIKGDLQTVTAASARLLSALEDAGYDVSKVSLNALQGLSPDEIGPPGNRVAAYVASHCG